jgi:methyl-accepting chemotaxis protein
MDIFGTKTKQLGQKIQVMEKSLKDSFSRVRDDVSSVNAWVSYYYQRSQYLEAQLNYMNDAFGNLRSTMSKSSSSLEKHSKMIGELADHLVSMRKELSSLSITASRNPQMDKLNFHIEKISKEMMEVNRKIEAFSYVPNRLNALREQFQDHLSASDNSIQIKELSYNIEKISGEVAKVDHKVEALSYLAPKVDALRNQLSEHITSPHVPTEMETRLTEIQERLKNLVVKKSPKDKLVQKVTKNSHDYLRAMILSYIKKYEKISAFQLREMIVEEQNLTSKSSFYRIMEEIEEMEDITTIREGKEKVYLSNIKKTA